MAHLVEWIVDPPEFEWAYDEDAHAMVATSTMVVHIYFHLSRMHEVVEPDPPLASAIIPKACLAQPLAPWDFPMSPLPNIEMEPIPWSALYGDIASAYRPSD